MDLTEAMESLRALINKKQELIERLNNTAEYPALQKINKLINSTSAMAKKLIQSRLEEIQSIKDIRPEEAQEMLDELSELIYPIVIKEKKVRFVSGEEAAKLVEELGVDFLLENEALYIDITKLEEDLCKEMGIQMKEETLILQQTFATKSQSKKSENESQS